MAQMFDHTLDAVKGWFHMAALDFTAKLSASETYSANVYAGRCVYLDSSGEFRLGCTGNKMPIFLLQNNTDSDVTNAGGGVWYPIAPAGNLTGLVAKGAYELETTEFDTAQTYYPNDYLKADNSSDATNGVYHKGRLTNQGITTLENATSLSGTTNPTAVVGVVSRPAAKRQSDRNYVLSFWPVYKPGKTGY
jgi:hypothetical protein